MKRQITLFLALLSIITIANAQTYKMKVVKTNGEIINIDTKNIKEVTFQENQDNNNKEEKNKKPKYITIADRKWATGNLIYNNGQWTIADNQWDYFNAIYGKQSESNTLCKLSDIQTDHFRWGICGTEALTSGNDVPKAFGSKKWDIYNISAKMYKDIECKQETKDFNEAKYGDLAFWATKGQWRMPSKADWALLKDACDWQMGYITLDNGKQIYGCLISPAKSSFGIQTPFPIEITKDKLDNSLFLPLAGYRIDSKIKNAAFGGYYWSAQLYDKTSNYAYEVSFDFDGFYINQNGTDATSGNCIRPILVEK